MGAPTCDEYGNCRGIGGHSDCGVLSYAMVDGDYADKVVAITDCLVAFPNFPAHISMTKVDYVVVVDAIGDAKKIATGAAKPTNDMRKLMMAEYCTQFVINSPYFKDRFSYQTGVGGASIASTISLAKHMKERNIRMHFGVGGLTKPMCDLLIDGQIDCLLDTQDFDLDVVVTDYGIAINPLRKDLLEAMKDVPLPFKTIEELRDIAYGIVGEPEKVQFGERVVGIIESRDGTVMDVVRQIKPFTFSDN